MDELFRLKNEQKKMALKIGNLEDYISELSATLSELSKTDSIDLQREKLSELKREMNIVSNTIINQDNIKRMSAINEEFFDSVQKTFPDLTESETLICYYLYLGMKNKEIATYMKSTVRAIESKRYRISKKMNLAAKDVSVVDYIREILAKD
jgi:DNA-binding NarL/FixJ family response regulator